jgi:hypothetical protein
VPRNVPRHNSLELETRGGFTATLAVVDGLSLRSEDSFLSIASRGSFLSIGSVGSTLSVCSVGSVASVFSIGSAASLGSVMSAGATASVLSYRAAGAVLGERDGRRAGLLLASALVAITAGALAFGACRRS